MTYVAKFTRPRATINGTFNILNLPQPSVTLFSLPARSGEPVEPDAVWKTGVGAIPMGSYYLWLRDPVDPGPDLPITPGGIGKTYRISNSLKDHDTISGGPHGQSRRNVRLHPENCYPGSAGCIALVWNVDRTLEEIPELKNEVLRLYAWLDSIAKAYEYISLEVH